MMSLPTLHTERLLLRPFDLADAPAVQKLAGDRVIAATTLNIPHPYEEGIAEGWIMSHPERYSRGLGVVFAVVLKGSTTLIGSISLAFNQPSQRAELGYWIGRPYWNRGYCTEAARAVVLYGFRQHGLNRIHASFMGSNPASGRVMEKIGMVYEGRLRQHVLKWGVFEDIVIYAALRETYLANQKTGPDSN